MIVILKISYLTKYQVMQIYGQVNDKINFIKLCQH